MIRKERHENNSFLRASDKSIILMLNIYFVLLMKSHLQSYPCPLIIDLTVSDIFPFPFSHSHIHLQITLGCGTRMREMKGINWL